MKHLNMECPPWEKPEGHEGCVPCSIEAEDSLLSAILFDPDAWAEVAGMVSPDDFFSQKNRAVFEAVSSLVERGKEPDVIAINDFLKTKGVHGAPGIVSSLSEAPISVNLEQTAKIVRGKALQRRLLWAAHDIATRCSASVKSPEALLADAQREICEIGGEDGTHALSLADLSKRCGVLLEKRVAAPGAVTGVTSGFRGIDAYTMGFQAPDLIVLAARPGQGKTALAVNIARLAAKKDVPVLFFSMEMSRTQLYWRMLAAEAKVNSRRFLSGQLIGRLEKVEAARDRLYGLPVIVDDTSALDVSVLRARAIRAQRKHRIGLIIIDYLQLGQASGRKREEQIANISGAYKRIAKDLGVPVLALCQMNREVERRTDPTPKLSDLRESGAIEQDADQVFFLLREDGGTRQPAFREPVKMGLVIAKNRNGPTGFVELGFIPEWQLVHEVTDRYQGVAATRGREGECAHE